MSHCVPSWDNNQFTDNINDHFHPLNPDSEASASAATKLLILSRDYSNIVPNSAPEVPNKSLDYEVAELTWENGQLALHGLGQPRIIPTRLDTSTSAPSGTLESIVNQATCFFTPSLNDKHAQAAASAAMSTMDALVPLCSNTNYNKIACTEDSNGVMHGGVESFTHVESCSSGRRVPVVVRDWGTMSSEYSANSSRQQATLDTCTERDNNGTAFTSSTSLWSAADNTTSSGMLISTKAKGDDRDSIWHSRSIMKNDGGSGQTKKKGSSSVRRSRAAATHNQSERRRRDKINQRLKTLQKLVPNSNKTDKASMLDEVIEYLKQLQAQVKMISRMNMNMMNMPQMTMMPMTLINQQALQMSMMSSSTPMGATAMGMGGMLDMNSAAAAMASGRANMAPVPPFMHPSSAFMPMQHVSWDPAAQSILMPDPMSTFLACQSHQPVTMDSYRMMTSLHQQLTPSSIKS